MQKECVHAATPIHVASYPPQLRQPLLLFSACDSRAREIDGTPLETQRSYPCTARACNNRSRTGSRRGAWGNKPPPIPTSPVPRSAGMAAHSMSRETQSADSHLFLQRLPQLTPSCASRVSSVILMFVGGQYATPNMAAPPALSPWANVSYINGPSHSAWQCAPSCMTHGPSQPAILYAHLGCAGGQGINFSKHHLIEQLTTTVGSTDATELFPAVGHQGWAPQPRFLDLRRV